MRRAVAAHMWVGLGTAMTLVSVGCQGRVSDYGGGTSGGGGGDLCSGTEVQAQKRVVRLTFNQLTSSIRALVDTTIADKIATDFEIVDSAHRTFPPLSNPREGAVITDSTFDVGDRIAQSVSQYVLDNFAAVTKCSTATDACAQQFVRAFGARALRRPLTSDETADFDKVYTDVKSFGGTVQEATQFGVYGVLDSPGFLYRTELGDNGTAMGSLSPYEMASALSYFLTDGPPDQPLLDAAAQNKLANRDQLSAQVDRILLTDAARSNFEGAMMSYFAIPAIEVVVIDTGKFPNWGPGLANSMYHESELFIAKTLWSGKVTDLLTSRRSMINTTLAPIYGVAPPAGAQTESDFLEVDLPDTRAGMLTQPGFLVARARPMAGSVVGRGLLVNAAFLCNQNPAFPQNLADVIAAANMSLEGKSEREKAAYRADMSHPCSACHPNFDPYGLALESFDTIGQTRTTDDQGRPIDTSVTLPTQAGGAMVANAAEMGAALAGGGAFTRCIAKNVMAYALAETAVGAGAASCATKAVADRFATTDGTFSSLVREIATSKTLAVRAAGGAQ